VRRAEGKGSGLGNQQKHPAGKGGERQDEKDDLNSGGKTVDDVQHSETPFGADYRRNGVTAQKTGAGGRCHIHGICRDFAGRAAR
jgi:hypothetical protein